MTWDLHGWLFHAVDPSPASSCAVFTFQTRGASETKFWIEDDGDADADDELEKSQPPAAPRGHRQKLAGGGGGGAPSGQGFCLLIQGFRSSSKIIA
uniref:Uncharacterized protein n=2 Tax=Oryza brachyantha TaxID=4533 RepID=J3LXJ6_ORYBR